MSKFGLATSSLKFESYDGGRDSKERLTQGLMVALEVATPGTLIVVFTDNGSKDLFLEDEIIALREQKRCEVYIVLTPAYEGRITGKSLPSYGRMGQVGDKIFQVFQNIFQIFLLQVFLINEVGSDVFLRRVQQFEASNCL